MTRVVELLEKLRNSVYFRHETKRSTLVKFLVIASILLGYFLWMSAEYGLDQGFMITILTWSFFVFCTPIADAGFLLDFPMRMVAGIRMLYSEVAVWIIAAAINIYSLSFSPQAYDANFLLTLFREILLNPFPYWAIIMLSAAGTFISVYFGDELIDVVKHEDRKKHLVHKGKHLMLMVVFVVVAIILYGILLQDLGLQF